ncbi:hypothetical protein NPIL_225161 [Nephila pilipes]|uniref:Uncharacterized protein n=1 Tax=Nephila pilipes TaxID=299642 RepID=A0A8X6NB09_NEPPI|nr:hypothetical protein NPIL_225161 [Nephila pilipes]
MPSATRMLRYAFSNIDFTIKHRKFTDHAIVDYFSRHSLPLPKNAQIIHDTYILRDIIIQHISLETVTANDMHKETAFDEELSRLKGSVLNGTERD